MRDTGTERALGGALRIHMNPLVIAGGLGEQVDPLLGDGDPLLWPNCIPTAPSICSALLNTLLIRASSGVLRTTESTSPTRYEA